MTALPESLAGTTSPPMAHGQAVPCRSAGGWTGFLKRAFDVALATTVLLLTLPLWLVLVPAVLVVMGRPVFFVQWRPGYGTQPLAVPKLRTMTNAVDAAGRLLPDAQRLTGFGRFLRATSLDELPQLWLVLMGQMSFIGPRPLLPQYLPLYSAQQRRRHEVVPGMTGLAQVAGRNAVSWPSRLRLDRLYAERQSLRLDLLILCRTLPLMLRRRGVSRQGHATTPLFTGNPERPRP